MKAPSLRAETLVFALVLCITALLFLPATASADGEDLRSALSDYAAGKYEEALEKLRTYVASNPENAEVYDVLRDVEQRVLLRALKRGGEDERLMKYLLHKSAPAERDSLRNADDIIERVKIAVEDGAWDKRRKAAAELQASGEYGVEHLFPYLGDANPEYVVNAILALRRLGDNATMPLVEVLASDNNQIRGHAAVVLGDLNDERALPALMHLAESDKEDSVRAKAQNAVGKLGGRGTGASNAFVELGQRYFKKDPEVVRAFSDMKDVWRWEDGALVRKEVPAYLYGYEVAEELAADALMADPSNGAANALLVRAMLAKSVEATAAKEKEAETPEGMLETLEYLVASRGFQASSDALRGAIADRDWDVAVACCGAMAKSYSGQELAGSAIGEALSAPDQRVRYAAAIAALKMNPSNGFPEANQVASIAARAAARSAVPQALILDDNNDTSNLMVTALNEADFVTGSDRSAFQGVNRAKGDATVDVVVIRANIGENAGTLGSQLHNSALMAIDELKADARTAAVRILVLVDEPKADEVRSFFQDKYGDKIAGFVEAPVVSATFVEQVGEAAKQGDLNADRERANNIAAEAANALANVDRDSAAFGNLEEAVGSLAEAAAKGNTEAIQLAAVNALGNLRRGGADALLEVLGSGNEDIKVAAAKALGHVLSQVKGSPGHIEGLMTAAGEGGKLRGAALEALGRSQNVMTPEQMRDVFMKHRATFSGSGE